MEENLFAGQGRIGIHMEPRSFSVAPGSSITVPVLLLNRGQAEGFFELSVMGIPTNWVALPSPVVRLGPGEQRDVTLTIQPPPLPHSRMGRHPLVIRATSQDNPAESAEVEGSLTVAAMEVQGRIGILLASTELSVVPGSATTVSLVMLNQGLEDDVFQLFVEGIPSAWVSTPSAVTRLAPGQQKEISLNIQPPRSTQSQAGRHPFAIQVGSQMAPGQRAEVQCTLTIGVFTEFNTELRPSRIESEEPARVLVENQGNIQQAFTLTWKSTNDELTFEPAPSQELRVPAGEVAMAEFQAKPRQRPFFGGEKTYPFTTQVQSADKAIQNLRGEVMVRSLIPTWVLPVVLVILAVAVLGIWLLSREPSTAPGTPEPTAPAATDVVDTPVPTEEPPVVPPTEEPSVEPPTEKPPVEPPTEEPPVQPTDGTGEGEGPELPCLPAAMSLVVVPLIMIGKRQQA